MKISSAANRRFDIVIRRQIPGAHRIPILSLAALVHTDLEPMNDSPPISVQDLHKSYGDFEALRGVDLEIQNGEVFGLLGPNGAGKTTTIEILEGLRPRTSGKVSVLGLDPAVQSKAIKARIGVCLQATNLPDKM
jgi:ABC-2 type transport system ATP-binding protein